MISRVTMRGFRGVRKEAVLELARLTLLSGRNGLGKTTVFDAIDWCLFGRTCRFGEDEAALRNLYDEGSEPYVALELLLTTGEEVLLERSTEGATWNQEPLPDREIALRVVRDPEVFPPHIREPAGRVRQLTYLPQTALRDLVSEPHGAVRAALLDALAGVPYAAVVTASLRKVRERLSERRRDYHERLRLAREEYEGLTIQLSSFDESIAEGDDSLLVRLQQSLDLPVDSTTTAEDTLRVAGERLRETQDRLRELAAGTSFVGEMEAEIVRIRVVLEDLESRGIEIESRLRRAESRLAAVGQEASVAQETQRALRERLDSARAREQRGRGTLVASGAVTRVKSALQSGRIATSQGLQALEEAESLSAMLSEELESVTGEVAVEAGRLMDLSSRLGRVREVIEKERSIESLRVHEVSEEKEVEAVRATRDQHSTELDGARKRLATATAALEEAVSRESRVQEIGELLRRIGPLVEGLGLSACPLCGTDFMAPAAFEQGMRASLMHVADGGSDEVRRLRTETELQKQAIRNVSRRVDESTSSLAARLGQLDLVRRDRRECEARLLVLRQGVSANENTERLEIDAATSRARIAEREAQRDRVKDRLRAVQEDLVRKRVESKRILEEMERLEVQLAEQEGALAPADTAESARQVLQEAELDVLETQARMEENARLLEKREAEGAQIREEISGLRAHGAAVRAEVAGATERMALAEEEIAARASKVLGEVVAPQREGIHEGLRKASQEATALRARLESEIPGLESLVKLREARRRAERVAWLRRDIEELQTQLEEVGQASQRFETVSEVLSKRRSDEGREAIGRVETTVQECLSGLTAHGHLDRVQLRGEGGLLLTDEWLKRRWVMPELFNSTGQQNVLALAVFLGLALRQGVSTLGVVLLDEPIQSLDDLNFLAFLSLLKRLVQHRQVVFSTADKNVATIARRQLRTWGSGEFAEYAWADFKPETGPKIRRVPRELHMTHAPGA